MTSSRRSSHAAASHPAPMTTFPRPSAASESQEPDSERNHRVSEEGHLLQAQALGEGRDQGRKTEAEAPKAETPKAETTEATATTRGDDAARTPKRSLSLPKRSLPKREDRGSNEREPGGRHKQVVGLSVGASQLSAAVVVNNGRPKLVKAARHTLPPDVVVGGEVRDSEALANEIAAFFSAADLPRKNVRLGIGSSRTGVRVFERPEVDDPRQLANAIRFRAYETLPIPIEEAMLDYQILEETNAPDRVLLAVAYRDLVDRFAATCAAAKIELVGIDIEAFALLRAVGGEPLTGRRASRGRPRRRLDRTRPHHGRGLRRAPLRVHPRSRLGRRPRHRRDPARARRRRRGGRADQALARHLGQLRRIEPADERTTKAAEAARREVNGLARELASSLHFYQDQADSLGFAEITDHRRRRPPSGARRAARRADRHQRPCRRPVRARRLRARHQLQRPGRRPRRRNRTGNRGLMRAVNLLPRQHVEQKRERPEHDSSSSPRSAARPSCSRSSREPSSPTAASTASSRHSPLRGPCSR